MTQFARSHVERFKGRSFNPRASVLVYRNLNRKGQWYSVMQGGRVVGHTRFLAIHAPTFIIRKAGMERALKTGQRNVHAFVKGVISYTELFFGDDKPLMLKHRAGYIPRLGSFYVDYETGWIDAFDSPEKLRMGMASAGFALLSKDGLSVDEPSAFVLKAV